MWRVNQGLIVATVWSTLSETAPSTYLASTCENRMTTIISSDTEFYSPKADPADRAALCRWLGGACAVADRVSGGDGRGIGHRLMGSLMQSWTSVAWRRQARPVWATPLFSELFRGIQRRGDELTPAVALRDLQAFLEGHQWMGGTTSPGHQRVIKHPWNQRVSDSCMAWRLLACVDRVFIPEALVSALTALEASYEPDPRRRDIDRRIVSAWEHHLLEGVGGKIASSTGEANDPQGEARPPRRGRRL